ncbi:MAG: hypothetical protein KA586_02170 [Candidatus Promineofilum sp.]|nr:hypothetical protein [Promineifilum sp.]
MEPLPVDIFQLRRRDPAAWSALLARYPETHDAIVTAVTSEALCDTTLAFPSRTVTDWPHHLRRYILTLAGCSDPITFIAKQTNAVEACFYSLYGDPPGTAIPRCQYAHLDGDDSWVVLNDVSDHFPPAAWVPAQVDGIVETLARFHAAHWNHEADDDSAPAESLIPHFIRRDDGPYTWQELRQSETTLFEEGPAAALSRHAIHSAGRLAPYFVRAANGLVVMRDLGGWPGVLGESHLAAAADLLDDPVPMLAPLLDLPPTLLHGAPHPGHWRLDLLGNIFLVDWSEAQTGPGILDLMAFIEGYPLLQERRDGWEQVEPRLRHVAPHAEETIIDTYLLTLAAELSGRSSARAFRAALPAARCLHVLLNWFPYFATWAGDMPDRYVWQRANRRSETEAGRYHDAPPIGMRRYLAGVFERFLRACRSL